MVFILVGSKIVHSTTQSALKTEKFDDINKDWFSLLSVLEL
jgi:hypothetical protein